MSRERLLLLYHTHNPEKVPTVDQTLAKLRGREDTLWTTLQQK